MTGTERIDAVYKTAKRKITVSWNVIFASSIQLINNLKRGEAANNAPDRGTEPTAACGGCREAECG